MDESFFAVNEIVKNRSDSFFTWRYKKFFNNLPQRKYFQLIRYLSLKNSINSLIAFMPFKAHFYVTIIPTVNDNYVFTYFIHFT